MKYMLMHILSIVVIGISAFIFIQSKEVRIVTTNTVLSPVSEEYSIGYLKTFSENTGKCDLSTITKLIKALEKNGYVMQDGSYNDKELDCLLVSKDIKVRINYNNNRELFIISDPYEKSYLPLSYINERE